MSDEEVERRVREDPDAPNPGVVLPRRRIALARRIRLQLGMSQSEFAHAYGFPLRTLQKWERHEREPSTATMAYLHAISAMPQAVAEAVAEGFDRMKAS
ncbi:helix-turn-helix domain-containing protein [Candidatus Poribacteria bacterium]|nr:helix-turn-helix domain-containing protein [Candidatus Poribacteria bacterium]